MDKISDGQSAKPAVNVIAAGSVEREAISNLLWGLEEEGIPAELIEVPENPAEMAAREAANASRLHVGIGLDGNSRKAVLHHRDLPEDNPLLMLNGDRFQMELLRCMGTNAARLVKGNPLVLTSTFGKRDDLAAVSRPKESSTAFIQNKVNEQLVELLSEIIIQEVQKLMNGADHGK